VDIVTFEMNEAEIRSKVACDIAGLDLFSIDQGQANDDILQKYDKALDYVADLPIRIHDNNMNIAQITSLMQEVKHDGGCGFFTLDYIQQILPLNQRGYSREQEVAQWSGAIMRTAKECHLATNVISQLSRASERDNRAPRLSDLRDSGALEQDAYRVMFIYQDPEIGEDDWADDVPTIFDVAANRRGPKGKIRMRFMKSQQHFVPDVHKNGG
jgi:replicative DNA helicase